MKYISFSEETLPKAYHRALAALEEHGNVYPCDNQDETTEMKEISICYTVEKPLLEPRISRLYPGGFRELQEYEMELTLGIKDFLIGKPLMWKYTYSERMLPYVDWVVSELKRNNFSRRATIAIKKNDFDNTIIDPPCMQLMMFNIRDEKLHMTVVFRSNDAVRAHYMNAFALIRFQEMIADRLKVEVGSYTHIAESFHAYKESFEQLAQYANDIKTKDIDELCYDYDGFYKEMMEESIPEIDKGIQEFKRKYQVE